MIYPIFFLCASGIVVVVFSFKLSQNLKKDVPYLPKRYVFGSTVALACQVIVSVFANLLLPSQYVIPVVLLTLGFTLFVIFYIGRLRRKLIKNHYGGDKT